MQTIAGKVNNAFSAADQNETFEQIGSGDSMSSISGKVKRNFARLTDDVNIENILVGDSMSTIAQKLKDNFDIVDQQEPEPPTPASNKFSFLHISDLHGSKTALTQMVNMLKGTSGYSGGEDCSFGLVTGDFKAGSNYSVDADSPYGGSLGYRAADFATGSNKPPVLITDGNHDCYDSWNRGADDMVYRDTRKMTAWMHGVMVDSLGDSLVNWGDSNNISSYWYKDFTLSGGNKLRLICIDQYEIVAAIKAANNGEYTPNGTATTYYNQIYTTAQFTWLVARLKELSGDDHFLITLHQSPFTDNSYASSIKPTEPYFVNGELREPDKLWCSELIGNNPFCEASYQNYNSVICKVVKAYLESSTYTETITNGQVGAGYNVGSFSVNADFTNPNNTPAKFWGYVFGHLHYDLTTPVPNSQFSGQLLMGITRGSYVYGTSENDDLVNNAPNYRINKVTIDFEQESVTIERIGQQLTNGGRTRDRIVFDMSDD